jgi:putative membrane protein
MPVARRPTRTAWRSVAPSAASRFFAGLLCAVMWMTAPVAAHVPGIVTPDAVWRAWGFEPLVLITLAVTSLVYARGVRRLWSSAAGHARGVSRARAWTFAAGQAVMVVALISPLDALGGTLLSAHMAQHGILAGLAPPLLLLGAPGVAFAWGVSGVPAIRRLAPVWRCLGGLAQAFSTPMRATVVHGLAMWVWHAPMLFGAAVEHEWVHALQHLSFFIPAILFWRALFDEHSAAHAAAAASAAFVTFMHTGLLGGLITMAPEPLYAVYVGRTESWGLTALADQHLAGLLMWVPLGIPYLVAGLVLTSRLVRGHVREVEGRLEISE